jgi:hypothetical protein
MIEMLRHIILLSYIFTILAGSSDSFVICFHPAHGFKIETSHEKATCLPLQHIGQPGIQKSNNSCIDTSLFEKSFNLPNIVLIRNVVTSTSPSFIPFVMVPGSVELDLAAIFPVQSSVSRHISTTVLRI